MMRKTFFYISALLVFAGCSESTYDGTRAPSLNRRYLYVPVSTLNFGAQPSSRKVSIESEQTDWNISVPADWLSLSQGSGATSASVEFTAEVNKSADISRVCVATISSDVTDYSRSFPITVTQGKNSPYITLADNSLSCSALQQSLTLDVSANTGYTIQNTAESWLHVDSYDDSAVRLSVDENDTGKERSAVLTLKANSYNGVSASIGIRQKIANITSTSGNLYFGHNGASQTIDIQSEASWTATSTSWISVSPLSGKAGKTQVTISVPGNASVLGRDGSVYFTVSDDNRVEVPVVQEGVTLSLSPEDITFSSFVGSQSIAVESNERWTVTAKPDWITLDKTSGTGNASLQATVTENNTTSERRGEITVTTDDDVVSRTIQVRQEAKNVEYADATLEFNYTAGTQSVSFTTDGNWSLTQDADWFSVDRTSGSGSATLTVTVTENTLRQAREGKISLLIADQAYTISIYQNCKYLHLSSSAFTFDSRAGSVQLSVSSNTDWKAMVGEGSDWISITPSGGTNDADIAISVTENKTVSNRSGKIEIEIPNVITYIVDVLQNRKYIKTDMTSVNFLKKGGQISFNVTTDGTYEVSKIGTWFGFVKTGDVITVVAPANETGTARTGAISLTLTDIDGTFSLLVPVTQEAGSSSISSVVNKTIKL